MNTYLLLAAILFPLFLLWRLVGRMAINWYLDSPYQLRNRMETIFFLLCGPCGWDALRSFYKAERERLRTVEFDRASTTSTTRLK